MKPIAVGSVFVIALVVIIWVGVSSASIPDMKVGDLVVSYAGGAVALRDGKVATIASMSPLEFTVCPRDDETTQVVVKSKRTVPENFKPGIDVGLEGHYDREKNVFHAYAITTQCPSKYEASKEGAVSEGTVSESTGPESTGPEGVGAYGQRAEPWSPPPNS